MFKDSLEGQTHFQNDGCGEPTHNDWWIEPLSLCIDREGELDVPMASMVVDEAERRLLKDLRDEIIKDIQIDKLSTMTMGDVGHNLAVGKILKLINSKICQ